MNLANATKANFPRVCPKKPETWINHAAPSINPELQTALTEIGGIIPGKYGEFAGRPIFEIKWGQSELMHQSGQMRIRFGDGRIPLQFKKRAFGLPQELAARASVWLQQKEEENRAAYMRADFANASKIHTLTEFLTENASSLDFITFAPETDHKRAASLLPEKYFYVEDIPEMLEIGKQCFFVCQWLPPEFFGSRSDWDGLRYDIEFHPELGREIFMDCLGPFPADGFYENVAVQISKPGEYSDFEYIEPTFQNTVEPVLELLRERDSRSNQENDKLFKSKQRLSRLLNQQSAASEEFSKNWRSAWNDAKTVNRPDRPASLPTVDLTKTPKKFGKTIINPKTEGEK
jgi:hypothetical protein